MVPPGDVDALNVIAIRYLPEDRRFHVLPDDAFTHDGQITKQPMRAVTLAALAPRPGELLWDVGAGSGSVGIEWCRSGAGCRAIAFELDEKRRARIAANANGQLSQHNAFPRLRTTLHVQRGNLRRR